MISDRDVYTAANLMIKQHGTEAAIFAAMNADRLAERVDRAGQALWLRVIQAIDRLAAQAPAPAERVH